MTMVRVGKHSKLQSGECTLHTCSRGINLHISAVDVEDRFLRAKFYELFIDKGNRQKFGIRPAIGGGTQIRPDGRLRLPTPVVAHIQYADGRYPLVWSEADGMHIVDLRERIG